MYNIGRNDRSSGLIVNSELVLLGSKFTNVVKKCLQNNLICQSSSLHILKLTHLFCFQKHPYDVRFWRTKDFGQMRSAKITTW